MFQTPTAESLHATFNKKLATEAFKIIPKLRQHEDAIAPGLAVNTYI
ncbi:MAG: hypothetical protein V7K47_21525 [Nostoc sp.]